MKKIKLVIWDLDETFWRGTLSEGEIEISPSNKRIIKELSERGVVNSICSKNDFNQVKEVLIKEQLWDYFIFPHIQWGPKGQAIQKIIELAQLRAENVLFLDDNKGNLEEVSYYNLGIHVRDPSFISKILFHDALRGKDDNSLSRLKSYKILEKKSEVKKDYNSNIKFLRQSEIKVEIIKNDLIPHLNRIYELIERTNQLNFTKIRLSRDEVKDLLDNEKKEKALVRVYDKYGDYGLVGFYCFDERRSKLEHFIFSCRILNMNVEQFLLEYLGRPKLLVSGDVSISLNHQPAKRINYIEIVTSETPEIQSQGLNLKVFFKGGCDLAQVLVGIESYKVDVIEESTYVGVNGIPQHTDHTSTILSSYYLQEAQKHQITQQSVVLSDDFFNTNLFSQEYDVIVFSVLMDYSNRVYSHKSIVNSDFAFGLYTRYDISNECDEDSVYSWLKKKGMNDVSKEKLKKIRENFVSKGPIDKNDFISNLKTIVGLLKGNPLVILVNGAEVSSLYNFEEEKLLVARHREMNKAIDEWIYDKPNIKLLDVRKFIKNNSDLDDSIRHYNITVYRKLSNELLTLVREFYGTDDIIKLSKVRLIRNTIKKIGQKLIR